MEMKVSATEKKRRKKKEDDEEGRFMYREGRGFRLVLRGTRGRRTRREVRVEMRSKGGIYR